MLEIGLSAHVEVRVNLYWIIGCRIVSYWAPGSSRGMNMVAPACNTCDGVMNATVIQHQNGSAVFPGIHQTVRGAIPDFYSEELAAEAIS